MWKSEKKSLPTLDMWIELKKETLIYGELFEKIYLGHVIQRLFHLVEELNVRFYEI